MGFDIAVVKDACSLAKMNIIKHKADIAFYAGCAGVGVSVPLFVRAGRANTAVVNEYIQKRKEIANDESLTAEQKRAATRENALKALKGSAKNYALPVGVLGGSFAALGYGFATRTSEYNNAATLAAGAMSAYELIKSRIIEAEGEDKWREYAFGEKTEHKEIVDPETGEVKVESTTNKNHDASFANFSFWFDEDSANKNFDDDPIANQNFLSMVESSAQRSLSMLGKHEVLWLRNLWETIYGTTAKFPAELSRAAAPKYLKDGTTNVITLGFRPNKYKAMQDFSQDTQDFWNGKRPDVRLTFTGFVPDIYNY